MWLSVLTSSMAVSFIHNAMLDITLKDGYD
jgi:hypothetical protein